MKYLGFKQVGGRAFEDEFEIRPDSREGELKLYRRSLPGQPHWEEITDPQKFLVYLLCFITGQVEKNDPL
jgi:hypothetical protein